jgi:hypothetical protein
MNIFKNQPIPSRFGQQQLRRPANWQAASPAKRIHEKLRAKSLASSKNMDGCELLIKYYFIILDGVYSGENERVDDT